MLGFVNNPERQLLRAVKANNVDRVRELVEQGANVCAGDKDGVTPLHHAAVKGHLESANILIRNGADVDSRTKMGNTPLHCAARFGQYGMAELLLSYGANKNAVANAGCKPEDVAYLSNYPALGEMIADAPQKPKQKFKKIKKESLSQPLQKAALADDVKTVRKLLRDGADPDTIVVSDTQRNPLLLLTAYHGHVEGTQALVDNGADIEARGHDGLTPLYGAVSKHRKECVDILLQAKADPNVRNEDGYPLLLYAVTEGYYYVTQKLLEAGADVTVLQEYKGLLKKSMNSSKHFNVLNLLSKHLDMDFLEKDQPDTEKQEPVSDTKTGSDTYIVTQEQQMGALRLSEAYDFKNMERITVVEKDGKMSPPLREGFEEISNREPLQQAFERAKKRGIEFDTARVERVLQGKKAVPVAKKVIGNP